MLDSETKRRIDTARDILVGKVPDPKSQVEQITIALIYKFMDDMDAQSEEFGGKRTFFASEFERYGWAKLMRSGLGGFEMLNLYSEAIAKMPENPGIPLLFRNIFKNAYLPYRDPETLRSFLKIIDDFSYDHSERLGDAFEYLLSVLGSQGDAGQFRTPRHIIDFMVAVLDPKKTETVLDPACGTAGFLISSYKHILEASKDAKGNTNLTPDERERLVRNFRGYDISPDMVRLSLVNLYLHGFVDPSIAEYDTLTSLDKWNEYADVILANPPFMSPKGGGSIKPHKRFSVQSSRSEVLFVDYIAEHLTPTGRAGIIVPEGIIFQSQNAYKQLRKMLVENFLVAVVSLPAGMFNPYSGVKTSILILDKTLAKKAATIGFFKLEKDGYGLGAQRRQLCNCNGDKPELCPEHSDIPPAHKEIAEYLRRLRTGEGLDGFQPTMGLVVAKEKVAANGDYNLSGERYREGVDRNSRKWPMVPLKEIARIINGRAYKQEELLAEGKYPVLRVGNFFSNSNWYFSDLELEEDKYCSNGDLLYAWSASFGPRIWDGGKTIFHYHIWKIEPTERIDRHYLHHILAHDTENIKAEGGRGIAMIHITKAGMEERLIPLPPLDVQKEIVAEIAGYQKIIDGARAVIENYRPHIPIEPDWSVVELGSICKPEYGFTERASDSGDARFIRITDISSDGILRTEDPKFVSLTEEAKQSLLNKGDILVARTGATFGKTMLFNEDYPAVFASFLIRLRFESNLILPRYYWVFAQSDYYWKQANSLMTGGGQPQFNGNALKQVLIPIPPLTAQQALIAEIEAEQALVACNKELVERFEKKIQDALARVWGEDDTSPKN